MSAPGQAPTPPEPAQAKPLTAVAVATAAAVWLNDTAGAKGCPQRIDRPEPSGTGIRAGLVPAAVASDRTQCLQVLVYLAEGGDVATLDEAWDAWVPAGHPPFRAVVRVGLAKGYLVEMVVTAAVTEG